MFMKSFRKTAELLVLAACMGMFFSSCATTPNPKPSNGNLPTKQVEPKEAPQEPVCFSELPGGKTKLHKECLGLDIAVTPGVSMDALNGVTVATFEIHGNAKLVGEKQIISKSYSDPYGATDAFTRRLLDTGIRLIERDRKVTDKRLSELDHSISGMVESSSAPAIGQELGAKVLIVGRYEFSGEFDYSINSADEIVLGESKRITHQVIRIKGLDIEKATILFDARISMTERVSKTLMPKTLAAFAAEQILDKINHSKPMVGDSDVQKEE